MTPTSPAVARVMERYGLREDQAIRRIKDQQWIERHAREKRRAER